MGRSTKKGPFVDAHLMVKIEALNKANPKTPKPQNPKTPINYAALQRIKKQSI